MNALKHVNIKGGVALVGPLQLISKKIREMILWWLIEFIYVNINPCYNILLDAPKQGGVHRAPDDGGTGFVIDQEYDKIFAQRA